MRIKIQSVLWGSLLAIILVVGLVGCNSKPVETTGQEKPVLVFADMGWDSIQFHNSVAQFIVENGYGYKTDVVSGSASIAFLGLTQGDVDICTEAWVDNVTEVYEEGVKNGKLKELSINFDDNAQGLYVPTYLIKGDHERGIKPLAPNLKSIKDLPQYWELFKDPEAPEKGRIYGAPPGWAVDKILFQKIKTYGLDKNYNYFTPGSDTALSTSLASSYEKGEPWLGYYWEPTWIMGKYDMTLITDEPYDETLWNNGYRCEFNPSKVTVVVNKGMETKAPDVVEFLSHYKTSSALTNEALAYMQAHDATTEQAAEWFLKKHTKLWMSWVPESVAEKVNVALKAGR